MRVLRVDLAERALELHPYVTVVRGLAPDERRQLVDALAAVPRGRAAVGGLVEAHGVLLPLSDETLEVLDLAFDLDPVLRAEDLPGERSSRADLAARRRSLAAAEAALAAAEQRQAAAEAAIASARHALDAARAGADDDVLAARRAEHERLVDAHTAARHAHAEAVAAHAAAARTVAEREATAAAAERARHDAACRVSAAGRELDATAAGRDPMAAAALETAQARLAAAEAAVGAAEAGEEGPVPAPTDAELDALRGERRELEAAVVATEVADALPVRLALGQLRSGAADGELVADPAALALADALERVVTALAGPGERAGTDEHPDAGGDERAAARARLVAAERAVAEAEAALQRTGHDSTGASALEEAHAALLEARDAAARRFGGRRAARRLAAAEAAEAAALERAGYASWSDYLMGARVGAPADEAAQRLDAAREELEAAAAAVRELDATLADELRLAELRDRRLALRAEAVELLTGDDTDAAGDGWARADDADLVAALRRRRVAATASGATARLREALDAAGLAVGDDDVPERLLVQAAEVWLEERERALAERSVLEHRLAEVDARLAAAERARAAADGPGPSTAAALAAVDEARAAVTAAAARVEANAEVDAALARLREGLEAASREEDEAAAVAAEAGAALLAARDEERAAAASVAEAEAAVTAAARAAETSAAALAELEARIAEGADRVEALATEVERAEADHAAVTADVTARRAAVDAARDAVAKAEAEASAEAGATAVDVTPGAAVAESGAAGGDGPDADDAEWAVLARVAAQRAVSLAGSVPLVVDDALARFSREATRRLLDRLERVASTVQIVVVTDDRYTAGWAGALGPDRAAVVGS